ncbi:MAG: NADH-quinone oxidoreductase subunit NuoE [Armatimonadota bacterium]
MLSQESRAQIEENAKRFPSAKSAILNALYVVQNEEGFVAEDGMQEIAELLGMPYTDVEAVATFYTLFQKQPAGKYRLDVCTTLTCSLLGAEHLIDYLYKKLGIKVDETTPDGMFTLRAVQCLGDCGNAPVMMVGDAYYDNLTPEKLDGILDELRRKAGESG